VLSPAYDLLPVNIIMPEDTEEFALTMNAKKRNLHRNNFFIFADAAGIDRKSAEKMLDKLVSMQPRFAAMIAESLLPETLKTDFAALLAERTNTLR